MYANPPITAIVATKTITPKTAPPDIPGGDPEYSTSTDVNPGKDLSFFEICDAALFA